MVMERNFRRWRPPMTEQPPPRARQGSGGPHAGGDLSGSGDDGGKRVPDWGALSTAGAVLCAPGRRRCRSCCGPSAAGAGGGPAAAVRGPPRTGVDQARCAGPARPALPWACSPGCAPLGGALHYALDIWFEQVGKPHGRGEALLCRYADDGVCAFRLPEDAERLLRVLPKRLGTFHLQVAPAKTHLRRFSRFHPSKKRRCTFLGCEFYG